MNEFEEFISKFPDFSYPLTTPVKMAKEFYYIPQPNLDLIDKCKEDVVSSGIVLGDCKNKTFTPRPFLLNLIAKETSQKVVLNEKSAWLFICGRDIFAEGILQDADHKARAVLVLNERGEVLGLAKFSGRGYNNLYDIGIFLRTKR